MNKAVSGHYQPGARENVAYLTSTERRRDYEAQVAQEKRDYEVTSLNLPKMCSFFILEFHNRSMGFIPLWNGIIREMHYVQT